MLRCTAGRGDFLRSEAGGATAFGVLCLMLVALFVGFAIDATNLYRHQALLRFAADAAAHAGAVALARGADAFEAEAAAAAMLARNLPERQYGRLVADPRIDLRAMTYDTATGRLALTDGDTPPNAMLVALQRSAVVKNPIPTFVLGLVGVNGWAAGATSVAALQQTRRCDNAEGIFAQGAVKVVPGSRLGAGLCLHSQTAVDLPPGIEIADDVRLSLPARDRCTGDCAGLVEANFVMPGASDYVARLAAGFAIPGMGLPEKAAFFVSRPLDRDLEPLAEVGVDTSRLVTGSVVPLSAFRFGALRKAPAGLVYLVLCDRPADLVPGADLDRIRLTGMPDRPVLAGIALITTCPVEMDAATRIEGSLVILLHGERAIIEAAPGAAMGDPARACDDRRRSFLMTPGNLVLPATLAASNLAVVAGGDILLAADPDIQRTLHTGLAVHAGGDIAMMGAQDFAACQDAADPLLPALRVIAHAEPPLAGWITPVGPAYMVPVPDMPGTRRKALATEGTRITGS